MTSSEIYACLRDLQMVPTEPRISEEQIAELVKRELIQRTTRPKGICLTQLGAHRKTGQI